MKVVYERIQPKAPPGQATHLLRVTHKAASTDKDTTDFEADCAKPGWKIRASDESDGIDIALGSASAIVEAIEYCIDKTSNRKTVSQLRDSITKIDKKLNKYEKNEDE